MIRTPQDLVAHILHNRQGDRNLSIRGLAKLCEVEHSSIIRDSNIKSALLAERLSTHGYQAGALIRDGFDAGACWIVIEYFAYYAKRAKAPGAKAIASTLGVTGVMAAFDNIMKPEVLYIPQPITVEPVEPDEDIVFMRGVLDSMEENRKMAREARTIALQAREIANQALSAATTPPALPEPADERYFTVASYWTV